MTGRSESEGTIESRLEAAMARGVEIVDPRQTWIAADVKLDRLGAGAKLYPGTRLEGSRCFLGEGAQVGGEGSAVLVNAVLDREAEVKGGYVEGAVLLRGAKVGSAAHLRPGTLLEEEASTAHAVGLKHTILMSYVTLGSLINFCDCLMAGGSSRRDHSEVGSGYIHFNFTPWGERGDKATASLIGDVPRGVFLREGRIFLGGAGGMVGPSQVGYGSVAAAGQVLRRDLEADTLRLAPPRAIERPMRAGHLDRHQPRLDKNLEYIGNLHALRAWYTEVRLPAVKGARRVVIEAALETLELCVAERLKQLDRFLGERGTRLYSARRNTVEREPTYWNDKWRRTLLLGENTE